MSDFTSTHLRVSAPHTITCKTHSRLRRNALVKNLEFRRTLGMMHRLSPNQSLQLTAGRSDTPVLIMKTPPLQSTFAPASGS